MVVNELTIRERMSQFYILYQIDIVYRILNLYVGKYENGKEIPVLFQKEDNNYIANIYLTNNEARDIEGDIIEDNTVVEFAYDKNLADSFRWIPLRTRMDKTDMVIKYKRRYGNSEWVGNKTWRSIMDGIEISDIELLSKLDTYETHYKYLKNKITAKSIEEMRNENKYYQEKNKLATPLTTQPRTPFKRNSAERMANWKYPGNQR
jgi:hypothetical protein